jgi:hypothetical protein
MRHLERYEDLILENTLFDPGIFQMQLRDALQEHPKGYIYVQKQLSRGVVPMMKRLARGLGLNVIVLNCDRIEDVSKWLRTILFKPPGLKTLVIIENLELAPEETIFEILNTIETREIDDRKISDLYYFSIAHLVDRMVSRFKDVIQQPLLKSPIGTTSYRRNQDDGTM